jgi:ABC-2 type transport system ATP-binding protein
MHNPDVLILDEPTAGLDPKQIIETRELIRRLAGEHTIILSTHILPEVEQTCQMVVIINKGKLVATDSVENLTKRLRGSEAVAVEVEGRDGALNPAQVRQRLEQIPGVSRVIQKEASNNRCCFEVESLQGRAVRADLARAIVEANWNLIELRPVAFSLEEIFLQLTASENETVAGGSK